MALAALLPLIEAIGPLLSSGIAAGSTAAATGTAAGSSAAAAAASAAPGSAMGATAGLSGGLSSLVAQFTGHAQGFGSAAELGAGVQRASDIAGAIAALKNSIGEVETRQSDAAASARYTDPATGMEVDNSQSAEHLEKLAALEKERAAMKQQERSMRAQLVDLNARIGQTNNPRSPMETLGSVGSLAGLAGGGAALAGMIGGGGSGGGDSNLAAKMARAPENSIGGMHGSMMQLFGKLFPQMGNMKQAALQPVVDLGMGQAEKKIASGATDYMTEAGRIATDPMALMRGEAFTHAAKIPGLLAEWSEGLVESKRSISLYNATLAQAFAEADHRGLLRQMESGQRTGSSISGLSDAFQDLLDEVQPIRDVVTTVMARGLETLIRILTQVVNLVGAIAKVSPVWPLIYKQLEKMNEKDPTTETMPFAEFMRQVNGHDAGRPRPGRPPR